MDRPQEGNRMIEEIVHFLKIDNRISTAGQPTAAQITDIANAGYEAVINLALPTSDNAIPNEGELVTQQGMAYVHLPIQFSNPTVIDFETFSSLMKSFADRKVFVHCAMNMRVSAFIYLHRVRDLKVPAEQAIVDLHRLWKPDETWQRLMDGVMTG